MHVVTQRVVSLLGLVVFPWEDGFDQSIKTRRLNALVHEGWPTWNILQGSAESLGDLVHHLRNALAHRRLHFSSESRDPADVDIEFADAKTATSAPYWRAKINADDLLTFCRKFIALVDSTVG